MASVPAGTSVLGRKIYFKGDLTADEDLRIEGSVEGSITHSGALIIGASAIDTTRGSTISSTCRTIAPGDAALPIRISDCSTGRSWPAATST